MIVVRKSHRPDVVFSLAPLAINASIIIGILEVPVLDLICCLLFLGAGSVIHAVSDEQDIRKMGGLSKILPFSYSII